MQVAFAVGGINADVLGLQLQRCPRGVGLEVVACGDGVFLRLKGCLLAVHLSQLRHGAHEALDGPEERWFHGLYHLMNLREVFRVRNGVLVKLVFLVKQILHLVEEIIQDTFLTFHLRLQVAAFRIQRLH